MNRAMGIKLQGLRLKVGMSGGGCVVIEATFRHWIAGWGGGEEEIEDFRGGVESHRAEWIRGLGRGSWLDEAQASPTGAPVLAEVDQLARDQLYWKTGHHLSCWGTALLTHQDALHSLKL